MAEKFSNVPKVTHVGGREANLDSLIPEPPFYLLLTTITDKPLQTSFNPSSNLPTTRLGAQKCLSVIYIVHKTFSYKFHDKW